MLASDANHLSASRAKLTAFFIGRYAGTYEGRRGGNTNDSQMKLPHMIHPENESSTQPHRREALRIAIDLSHNSQKVSLFLKAVLYTL